MQLLKASGIPPAPATLKSEPGLMQVIQRKVAVSAVPASAMRGQGVKGVVSAARNYLATVSLTKFATAEPVDFKVALDQETMTLRAALPHGARKWGLARKVVNLFLRDAFYNSFLSTYMGLSVAENLYELPLDSIVAAALKQELGSEDLPSWPGLKLLTPRDNEAYQSFATVVAATRGILRVHLDAYYWAAERPLS